MVDGKKIWNTQEAHRIELSSNSEEQAESPKNLKKESEIRSEEAESPKEKSEIRCADRCVDSENSRSVNNNELDSTAQENAVASHHQRICSRNDVSSCDAVIGKPKDFDPAPGVNTDQADNGEKCSHSKTDRSDRNKESDTSEQNEQSNPSDRSEKNDKAYSDPVNSANFNLQNTQIDETAKHNFNVAGVAILLSIVLCCGVCGFAVAVCFTRGLDSLVSRNV